MYIGVKNIHNIYLAYTGSHFNVIKKMNRFCNRSYYCHSCKQAYNNIKGHSCQDICKSCNRLSCEKSADEKREKCNFCNVLPNNPDCLKSHKHEFCTISNKFPKCKKIIYKKNTQVCLFQKYCKNCNKAVELDHQCYILREDEKKFKKVDEFNGYIWFDYETYEENNIQIARKSMY